MKTTINILFKIFFLVLAIGWGSGAWAEAVFVTPTYVSSTNAGSGSEGPDKLVDGKTNTKWGLSYTNGSSQPSVVVRVNGGMVLRAYKLFNGNDTNSQPGRRWKKWSIEGSNDQSTWTPIHTIYDGRMNTTNYAENLFTVKDNNTSYEYYRITVLNNEGAGMIQMSELQFSSSPLTEFPTLRENVNVSFVGGEAPVKYYDPESETPITITAGTKNYGNILYDARFLGAVDDFNYSRKNAEFNNAAQTLTLTLALNKWYTIRSTKGYLNSEQTAEQGLKFQNSSANNVYSAFWRIEETGDGRNGGTNVHIYNAKYYDTKILAMGGNNWNQNSGNAARANMFDTDTALPANYATEFEMRANGANQTFRVEWDKASNSYFNAQNAAPNYLALWNANAYGDGNSQFTVVEVPTLGENVNVIVNAPAGVKIKYNTQCDVLDNYFNNVTDIEMRSEHFNFHNMPFLASLFSYEPFSEAKFLSVHFDESTQTLTLSVKDDPNFLQYSPAPTADGWAEGTKWFSIQNNRSNQGAHNYKYLSTAESSVNDNHTLKASIAALEGNRGEAWAFVETGSGMQIYNAAYGPDFVLGSSTTGDNANATFKMVHKDNTEGYYTIFSAVPNSVLKAPSTHSYGFRVGTSGNVHVHVTNGTLRTWNHAQALEGSNNDGGSSFTLTAIEDLDALTAYDVYTVKRSGAPSDFEVTYGTPGSVFGKQGHISNGATFIVVKDSPVSKENFQVATSDYVIEDVSVRPQSGHACKLLTIRLRDVLATEKWSVRVNDGYHVSYTGAELADGETFFTRPNVTLRSIDFNILDTEEKFVWGPIIDAKAKTVTYDVRDRATELASGWYQLQIYGSTSETTSLRDKIKTEEGNINTPANTLYLAPAVYEPGNNRHFKVTGVPTYGTEASTFVYIRDNGSGNYTFVNPRTGAEVSASGFTFADGRLTKSTGWSYESSAHPLEGPYLTPSGNQTMAYNVAPVDVDNYEIYSVNIVGAGATSDVRVNINNASVLGNKTVGNGGYLFMAKGSNAPMRTQFSVSAGNVTIDQLTLGDKTDGVTPITLTVTPRQSLWTIKVSGNAKTDADRVIYNNLSYSNDDMIGVAMGTVPTALEFTTNVTDRFVWGPVINENNHTISFEIKTPVDVTAGSDTPLTTDGWYQFMLVPYTTKGANFINAINQVSTGTKSRKGSYVYMFNAEQEYEQNSNYHYPMKYAAVPASGDQATSFFYVKANGRTPQFQVLNGHYVHNSGYMTTSPSNMQGMDAINNSDSYGQNIYGVYRWSNYNDTGAERPFVGASGTGLNYYVRAVKVDPTTMYDVYQVELPAGHTKVSYVGSDNHGITEVYDHGYFFLTKDAALTKDNFRLEGNAVINSITIDPSTKVVTFNATTPTYDHEIIHSQAKYYDMIESDANQPNHGFIKEGEGWNVRTGTNGEIIREQNTAVFEIPIYLKPGDTQAFTSYLPTNQLGNYQRWYNWDTDGRVNDNVLTYPSRSSVAEANRYNNGHLSTSPTLQPTFKLPAGMESYNVGLDISRLTDGQTYNSGALSGCRLEPTLGMRIIYQVRDAKLMAKDLKTKTAAGKFLEVHNIAFPNVKHGKYEDKTISNLLPLDLDLNNYWIFDGNGETDADLLQLTENGSLQMVVELAPGSAPLQHVMKIPQDISQESGNINYSSFNTGHFILFQYPDGGVVEPGAEATINVYLKKNGSEQKYNLAQFNLTFIGNAEPVPITELPGSHRHPDALAEAFGAPVSELTFDNVANEEYAGHYRYPLNFKGVSYAFGNMQDRTWFASRGEYALRREAETSGGITNVYYPVNNYLRNMANPTNAMNSAKEDDSYFLYIDAADQPGKVASIELEDALCAGSRLYCYGYIGCTSGATQFYGDSDKNQNPTSILINVMGIDKDTDEEVLVYSYCPGIISSRGYDKNGRQVWSSALGRGTVYENHSGDTNYWSLWQQVGFSFAISGDIASQMKGYSVQIVNNAYNSNGADTVLDDFEIYVKKPGAEVQNTTPLCSDQIRHIKVITEYGTLLEATGEDVNHDGLMNVGFCFLDKEVFDKTLADNIADIALPRNDANNAYNKAFGAALMGERTLDRTNKDHAFHNFNIIRDGEVSTISGETKQRFYTDIPQYSFKESGDDVVYRDSIRGERYIVFKESVAHGEPSGITEHKWTAGKSYYLLFSTATISNEHVNNHDLGCTVFNLDDNRCAVMYEFTVAPPVSIKGDVEEITSGDEVVACAGQTPTITVNLNGRTETQDIVIKNLTYDWWLGYVSHKQMELENGVPKYYDSDGHAIYIPDAPDVAYNTLPATMQNYMNVWWGTYSEDHTHLDKRAGERIYLSDAMLEFRRAYPNATDLTDVVPKHAIGDVEEYELTQEMIDCIAHFLKAEPESGYTPLVLSKKELNLTLSHDKADADKVVHFVVIPIAPGIYSVDEDAIYCPDPQELKVKLLNEAPQLANGFANMPYPETMENIPVRIGLQQINNVRHRGDATQRTLSVPVRKPFFAYPEGTSLIKSNDVTLYLVGTDDPAYKRTTGVTDEMDSGIFNPSDDDIEEMFVEAGEVKVLAVPRGAATPTMQVIFNNSVQFREGYTYTLKVKFYEMQDDIRDRACEGSFVFDMKVVPEYLVWTGSAGSTDWTNDDNWRRADRAELHAGNEATGNGMTGATALNDASSYASNATNTTARSFVPMYFTNVLFKANGTDAVELYKGNDFKRPAAGTNFLEGLEATATPAIVYDMAVTPVNQADRTAYNYDCNYQCELFDTYVANGVTFEPGTQMGNVHYLTYNKAWVEYELDANRWYTIASPLKKSVAGDWYSPTAGGKQLTPHFYEINYDNDLNDRYRPAYYQRSWDRDGNNIVYSKTGGTYDAYVRADWSNVYNDATVNYNAGGFSVKAELDYMDPADRPADGKVLVRLPKADTSYTYYDVAGATGQAADAQIGARTESYRLLSDDLRADGTGSIAMSVSNETPDNNFLLLSNPFMAAMDMDEFFARNTDLEEKYWIVSADRQMVSVRSAADGEWITTGEAGGKYVAPLQGFFVKKKDGALNPGSVRAAYTAAMQTVVNPDPVNPGVILRAPASRATADGSEVIRLTAERNGAESTALIVLSENAHDGNVAGEDCETFIDGNLYALPTVYTAAGGTAQTINVRKSLHMVPIGIISSDDSPALLRFNMVDESRDLYLYDSEADSYTAIFDGTEVTMSGNNAGRYFLVTGMNAVSDDTDASEDAEDVRTYNLHGIRVATSQHGTVTIRGSRKTYAK